MPRRKTSKSSIRNVQFVNGSYLISIPARIAQKIGLRKRQKVVVSESRNRVTIKDWKKKRR